MRGYYPRMKENVFLSLVIKFPRGVQYVPPPKLLAPRAQAAWPLAMYFSVTVKIAQQRLFKLLLRTLLYFIKSN